MTNYQKLACFIRDVENWDAIEKITGLSDELDDMTMDEIQIILEEKFEKMPYKEYEKWERKFA